MKTSVNMVRKLDVFDVVQRTKDGMFDANVLLRQWNKEKNENLKMSRFFESEKVKEFIQALEEDTKTQSIDSQQSTFLHLGDYQVVKEIKGRRDKTGLKSPDQVWMHPILFIKFAMWLNPAFEVKVIKFVYDELIKDRHLAGDNYRLLSASISKFPDVNYPEVARALNWIIFNRHHPDIRNAATTDQIKELHELEQKLAYAVDMNLITLYPQLIQVLRDTYNKKHPRF